MLIDLVIFLYFHSLIKHLVSHEWFIPSVVWSNLRIDVHHNDDGILVWSDFGIGIPLC